MDLDRDLLALHEQYRRGRIPKLTRHDIVGDVDIDVAEEDAYLAGLVDQYIHTGALNVDSIELNSSIDERLRLAQSAVADDSIDRLIEFRVRMLDLAASLSAATGVPLNRVST
jgi:hypothetical protein